MKSDPIRPIRTVRDHAAAVAEIERLWDAKPGTAAHDRLEVLAQLASAYEDRRWPIDAPDPVEAIKFHMEQRSLAREDLVRVLGSASRASEVLRRRRRLTIDMAWRLHEAWGIPADSLIRPYKLAAA